MRVQFQDSEKRLNLVVMNMHRMQHSIVRYEITRSWKNRIGGITTHGAVFIPRLAGEA